MNKSKEVHKLVSFSLEDMKARRKLREEWDKKHPVLTWIIEAYYFLSWRLFQLHIVGFFRNIKWGIQRWKRGYSDCDAWNFDSYLSDVIANGLKHLKKTKFGYPGGETTEEKWDEILDDIIFTFELEKKLIDMDAIWSDSPAAEAMKDFDVEIIPIELKEKHELGWKYFREFYYNLWD